MDHRGHHLKQVCQFRTKPKASQVGRASRRKRNRIDPPSSVWPSRPGPPQRESAAAPRDKVKLSEALVALIEPYRREARDLSGYRLLITLAALAWNLAALPQEQRDAALLDAARGVGVQGRSMLKAIITEVLCRKLELFPEDHRVIVSYEVTESAGTYHVLVASAG